MNMRSEFSANIALTPTTKNPTWRDPAPIRCRKTYGILAILRRHPLLFTLLTKKK